MLNVEGEVRVLAKISRMLFTLLCSNCPVNRAVEIRHVARIHST